MATLIVTTHIFCYTARNRLVSVWEDSTCHYHAKVQLSILCSFEQFVPYKENVSTAFHSILCTYRH